MKFLTTTLLLWVFKSFASYYAPTENEILELQELRELQLEIEIVNKQIDQLEKNPCIINNDHYNECSKVFLTMEELLESRFEVSDRIEEIKINIIHLLDENNELPSSYEIDLEERFPISGTCPRPNLESLIEQADSMLLFTKRLRQLGVYNDFMDVTSAQKRDCDEEIDNDCWQVDEYGNVFYVTKYGLKLEASCFVDDPENPRSNKYSPNNIIRAANLAMERMKGCFSKINPQAAKQILARITKRDYMMFCKQSAEQFDRPVCGYAQLGSDIFNLVFNDKTCPGYEETIFHEMLHMNKGVDNLSVHNHHRGECTKHDAIYFCSRFCFPESTRDKINFSKKGCEDCIKNPDEVHLCEQRNFNNQSFDDSYFSCN